MLKFWFGRSSSENLVCSLSIFQEWLGWPRSVLIPGWQLWPSPLLERVSSFANCISFLRMAALGSVAHVLLIARLKSWHNMLFLQTASKNKWKILHGLPCPNHFCTISNYLTCKIGIFDFVAFDQSFTQPYWPVLEFLNPWSVANPWFSCIYVLCQWDVVWNWLHPLTTILHLVFYVSPWVYFCHGSCWWTVSVEHTKILQVWISSLETG